MSAAVEVKQDPIAKFGSQVDDQIAQTTGRIRAHDLVFGTLSLAALTAIYATVIILLDRYLVLPEWVRQIALLGFLLAAGGMAYWLIVRPFRNRINPLYAAARVESTLEDPKNIVTGYVEAQQRGETHAAVKTAMSARAARAVADADVNHAVDHRSLVFAGGVLLVFLLTLAVLFFVFRPAQFRSLMTRAFVPLSSDAIAKRTQIDILRPDPTEPTITTGQTITVAVHIRGKVPASGSPERARILLRHTQADPNYEVIPMEEGETSRDWHAKVPDYLVQNGFWYRVAAGDNETQEYRVTVRTLPMFTDYESAYEYPAYMRKPGDRATGPNLRAYKGTKITLIGKTNRDVADGTMRFDATTVDPVAGRLVPGRPDCLEFKFVATENTRYKLTMTSTTGDKVADAPSFALTLDSDLPPAVQVTKPVEPEITLVANGQLAVDGTIGDDFGIDRVRLRMSVDDRELKPVPYRGGESFLRAKDNTWPTDIEFKLSADLTKLTYADGSKFTPVIEPEKPVVLEYWVEAIDNCTETKPVADWDNRVGNVGRSKVQRVRLAPSETAPERKQELEQQKNQRAGEEKQHNTQQQQKLDQENRKSPEPQEGKEPEKKDDRPGGKAETNPDDKKGSDGSTAGMPDPANPPKMPPDGKKDPGTETQPGGGKSADTGKGSKRENPPKSPGDKKGMADDGMPGGTGMPEPGAKPPEAPMPKSPEDRKTDNQVDQVQRELDKSRGPGGDAKPNPGASTDENRTEPAETKPQQPPQGMDGTGAQSKPEPKAGEPMPGGDNAPSQSKPQGNLEQKPNPDSSEKPGPQQRGGTPPESKPAQPSESRSEPLGGTPGQEKPEPKDEPQVDPKDPNGVNRDPKSGSSGKPATQKPEQKDGMGGNAETRKDPAGNAAQPKPNAEPSRGMDREPTDPKAGSGPQPNAGDAKPQRAPNSADTKPMPREGQPGGQSANMANPKPAPTEPKGPNDPKTGGASESKPEMPPTSGGGMDEKGIEKGSDKPADGTRTEANAKSDGRKPTEKEMKDLQQAAQDLDSPDAAKRKDAQEKLDRAVGEEKRKELEQLQKDLKSSDPATRDAARKKAENLMNQARKDGKDGPGAKDKTDDPKQGAKGTGSDGAGAKLSEKEMKDLQQAAQDLDSPDAAKRKDAQEKLDRAVGEEKRKELEQLQKDLKSSDPATRDAARKKAENLMNQARKDGPGEPKQKDLSPEEIADLAKKAQDLNSKDEGKRREAEQAIDEKLGKDAREKLQDALKSPDPKGQEDLKKQIEEMARNAPGAGKGPIDPFKKHTAPGASTEPPLPAMEDDPRNRAKSAQLQLEEFERHRYDKDLQDRLGWTQEKYDEFLKSARQRAEEMSKEAQTFEDEHRSRPKLPAGAPTLTTGGGGKVDARANGTKVEGSNSGAVVAPPGFEGARPKFLTRPKGK